jgi:hypothetical protein
MPEYDAFGREIGEDTLANWRTGEGATAAPSPAPPPAPAPDPAAASPSSPPPQPVAASSSSPPQAAPPQAVPAPLAPSPEHDKPLFSASPDPPPEAAAEPYRPRPARGGRSRRPRVVSRLIVLAVVVVAGVNLLAGAGSRVKDAVDGLPKFSVPTPAARAADPVGLQAGSLIRPEHLRNALAELRRRDLGKLDTLRLAPERIDATLLSPRGTLISVQLRHDGEFRRFSESGPGFGGATTIPFARLDPRAPQRLVRAAAERLNRQPSQIDYLVPSISEGKVSWGAYFKGGAIFLGNARGKLTRRIS